MRNSHWMRNGLNATLLLAAGTVQAQDANYIPQATQDVGYAAPFEGAASVGSAEPLFRYDDQERWKHGYIRNVPYYEGYSSFRPYNYHHVFSQTQTSAGWGMPATMPYSQQFWHRYENMVDLSRGDHTPVAPYVPPPKQFEHYPKPIGPGAQGTPNSMKPIRLPQAPELSPPREPAPSAMNTAPRNSIQPASNWNGQQLRPAPALLAPF